MKLEYTRVYILSSIVLLCFISNVPAQVVITDIDTFDFKKETPYDSTILKNDCKLIYTTSEVYRNLWFFGRGIETVIWSNSVELQEKYMGWVTGDFENYFVLYSSGGNYTYYMNLISKKSGTQVLEKSDGVDWLGVYNDTVNSLVYYDKNDSLFLLDLKNMSHKHMEIPKDLGCIYLRARIDKLEATKKEIIMTYRECLNDKIKHKKYLR